MTKDTAGTIGALIGLIFAVLCVVFLGRGCLETLFKSGLQEDQGRHGESPPPSSYSYE